ncbi:MAG: PKD domain-containing protein [Bacteroidetes bacterium]|nr:PKD domain-containing protein [Bacteroidota bacterium]
MKKLLLFASFLFTMMHVTAQRSSFCATDQYAGAKLTSDSNQALEAFIKNYIDQHHTQGARSSSYVIPVVFHIIHDGGSELLTDSVIITALNRLNEFMSASNAGLTSVVPAFDTLIGNAQVEFRLAQKDPLGNCTNGIERIYTQATYVGNDYTKINDWPRDKYLNIWLVKGIDYDFSYYGTLGYAFEPGTVASAPAIDGILVKSFILLQLNDPYDSGVLPHMVGHWADLLHPESACTDTINDYVADTPPMQSAISCNLTQSICNPPIIENVQNIMAGSSCPLMFTKGQVNRMWAALNASTAGRNNISSSSNLLATGTDVSNPVSCAIPIADFAASTRYTCINTPVIFTDASYNADITSRTWTFPSDANTNTTSGKVATVSFSTPGWHQVTLQVSNTNGSDRLTKNMVYVTNGSQTPAPLFDGFEYSTPLLSPWQVINYDNNNTAFQLVNSTGHHSQSCYKLNEVDAMYEGDVDILASPPLDLSAIDTTNASISFDYSFATSDAAHLDDSTADISVWLSNDCGASWHRLYHMTGSSIFNAGLQTGSYTPGTDDQYWQNVSVHIPSLFWSAGINFEIRVKSGVGTNNLFIDNINVGQSTLGLPKLQTQVNAMGIVPNPAAESADLVISCSDGIYGTIQLLDMAGRTIQRIYTGFLGVGGNHIHLNTNELSSGIYSIQLSDGVSTVNRKFVKF